MKNRIHIQEINEDIYMTIYQEIYENIWSRSLKTGNQEIIKDFIKNIKHHIQSSNIIDNKLNLTLSDHSTVKINNYTKLQEHPLILPLTKKVKNKNIRIWSARTLLITFSLFAGLHSTTTKLRAPFLKEIENSQDLEDLNITINPIQQFKTVCMDYAPKFLEKESRSSFEEEIPLDQRKTYADISYNEAIPSFGQNAYDERISFVHENYGEIIEEIAKETAIDPHLLECIYAQERTEHSSYLDPLGTIGIAQLQYSVHINRTKILHHVYTNEQEKFIATDNILRSLEGNIKVSIAYFQDMLIRYNGNTLMALQAYNYGDGAMNTVLRNAERRTGISKEEMINDPSCLVWIEDIKRYKNGNYGDPNYLENVLSRYNQEEFKASYGWNIYGNHLTVVNVKQKTMNKSRYL